MERICICCPVGCKLTIEERNGEIIVTGNACPRGKAYGISEYTLPERVLTTTLQTPGATYTLKTKKAIPKSLLEQAIIKIKGVEKKDYSLGEVVIENLLETGTKVVVTGKLTDV